VVFGITMSKTFFALYVGLLVCYLPPLPLGEGGGEG